MFRGSPNHGHLHLDEVELDDSNLRVYRPSWIGVSVPLRLLGLQQQQRKKAVDDEQLRQLVETITSESDLEVEYDLPNDATIELHGKPILALNPATNNLTVPSTFLHHPQIKARYFFTLPNALWDVVISLLGEDRFDADALELERQLSRICGDHSSVAGFWQGRAFVYNLLRPIPGRMPSAEDAAWSGRDVNKAKFDNTMRLYEERSKGFARVTQAYAGWLLTNRTFVDEHNALFVEWSDMVQRWGLNRLGILLPTKGLLRGDDPTADPRWTDYSVAFEEFFSRWRLLGLAAPYLPIPIQPLMGGAMPMSVLTQLNRARGAFCLPDTFPVSSRDDLRNILEDALRGSEGPDHLKDWQALIARDNSAKKPLGKFARLFEVQHYWRILRRRHPRAIHRKLGLLKVALSEFLKMSTDSIHRDLLFIGQRLGKDWFDRGGSFSFGPF